MGIGIIFCMTEIQLLQDLKSQISEGQAPNERIATLINFFPKSYCAFEVIVILRILFFLCFNIVNSYSICFIVDDTKAKLYLADEVINK
jgi:hypothetical protein